MVEIAERRARRLPDADGVGVDNLYYNAQAFLVVV
jgi:hypothetical protein